jgi:O-antigen ligase
MVKKDAILNLPESSRTLAVFIMFYIILHGIYICAAIYNGVAPATAIRRFLQYSDVLYFFLPVLFIREKSQLEFFIAFIVVMAVLALGHQIYSFAGATRWRNFTSSGTVRLGLGGVSILACALFALLSHKNSLKYYFLATCPILSIILVGHRSGLIALGAALLVFFLVTKKITKFMVLVYVLSGSLIVALAGMDIYTGHSFIDDTLSRSRDTFNFENRTSVGRLDKIKNNYMMFKKNPIFGFGYNYENIQNQINYSTTAQNYEEVVMEIKRDVMHPHNFVFRYLSHTGIFGFSIIMAITYLIFKKCRNLIKLDEALQKYGTFLLCSNIFFILFALWNTTFTAEGWVFWILAGICATIKEKDPANEAYEGVAVS